jgi:recombination protein RecA
MSKSKITEFIEELQDKYGEEVIVTTESHLAKGVIPTGSLSLDISLGVGGIPRGTFTQIYGPESSGKTTQCLAIVKEALKLGVGVLYIDVERALDYRYIRAVVGDFDEKLLVLASPETAEDAFETAESGLDSGIFGLIIIDSLAAMSPEEELQKDFRDNSMTLLSRALNKFLRRNSFKVKNSDTAFIFVNQVRANFGSYMGGYTTPGGYGLKHFLAVTIKFTKGTKISKGSGKSREIVGVLTKFSIQKNKLAPPYRGAEIPIIFGEGIDYLRDVIQFGERIGVIRRAGSYYRYEDQTLGQGMDNSKQYLSTNPETLDKIVKSCYNILDNDVKEQEVEDDEQDEN